MIKYNLLIVDDEESITNGIVRIFHKHEKISSVFSALNGEEALEIVRHNKIDIIICDIVLPAINGLDLCRQIYREYPQIKIIMTSGYDDFDYARQALEFKAISYLLKPTSVQTVLDVTEKAICEIESRKDNTDDVRVKFFSEIFMNSFDNNIPKNIRFNININMPFNMIVVRAEDEQWQRKGVSSVIDEVCEKAGIKRDVISVSDTGTIIVLTDEARLNLLCDDIFVALSDIFESQPIIEKAEGLTSIEDCVIKYRNICMRTDRVMEQIKKYVSENLSHEVTLKEIAKRVHMNVNYLSSYFKKNMGINFSDYVAQEKLAKAKYLLVFTDDKCYEIAQKIGYIDQRNFSSFFKNMTGVAPLEFKERYYGKKVSTKVGEHQHKI